MKWLTNWYMRVFFLDKRSFRLSSEMEFMQKTSMEAMDKAVEEGLENR